MGSCSGKQDVISQNSLIAIETGADDVKRSDSSRKQSQTGIFTLSTSELIEDRKMKTEEKTNVSHAGKSPKTKTSKSKQSSALSHSEKIGCDKKKVKSKTMPRCDVGTDPMDDTYLGLDNDSFISTETNEHIEKVYKQFLSTKHMLGESDGEWLEVIHESDEFEPGNDDVVSLVESEIIEDYTVKDNEANGDNVINDQEEKSGLLSEENAKGMKRKESKVESKRKTSVSSISNRKLSNEKKKVEKNKANKTKHEKLWTSRSTERTNWMQEKVYTTKAKDGMLFKIKILRKTAINETGNRAGESICIW